MAGAPKTSKGLGFAKKKKQAPSGTGGDMIPANTGQRGKGRPAPGGLSRAARSWEGPSTSSDLEDAMNRRNSRYRRTL